MELEKTLGKQWERYLELKKERPDMFVNNGLIHIVTDEETVRDYQEKNNRVIGVVYESPYNIMLVDLVYEEEGQFYAYERLVPAVENPAVVIVPIYNDSLILLKQYRHALRDYQYAFPRGFGEKGLSGEENCQKELFEEIGAVTEEIRYLGEVTPDSGVQANSVSIYICKLSAYNKKLTSEGICEILEISYSDFVKWIKTGKITDGFTIAAWSILR